MKRRDGTEIRSVARPVLNRARMQAGLLMFEVDEDGSVRRLDEDPGPFPLFIHDAATAGDIVRLTELLEQNPSLVHALDANKRTPLHDAAVQSEVAAAELLLSNGADVQARDRWGATPLSYVGTYEEPLA